MLAIYIGGACALFLAIWAIYTRNVIVRARNKAQEAFSGIDVQLKLRRDLVPNLVEAVAGYARHERESLLLVAEARTHAEAARTPAQVDAAEQHLAGHLRTMFAVAERYPELRASRNFSEMMVAMVEIENEIQAARALYNQNVRVLNSYAQSFPVSLVAGRMRSAEFPYLSLEGVGADAARLLGEGFAA